MASGGWAIKFSPDAKPGVKRKAASGDKDASLKRDRTEYEKNRRPERAFNDKWKENREWLKFDPETNKMTCSYCVTHYQKCIVKAKCATNLKNKMLFVSGCSNFRASTITDHERSVFHQETTKMHEALIKPSETTAAKSVQNLKSGMRTQMNFKFRNMHAIVKKNRPLSDFTWLNELDKAKGFDHGTVYDNLQGGKDILSAMYRAEVGNLVKLVQSCNFFSITMDGSTDDSIIEQETLFIRTSIAGNLYSRFMCIGEPESTCSADLYSFVIDQLKSNKIYDQMSKFVGFGSDGASNMTGVKNGLVTLLKKDYPELIGIHCLGHRLELAFRDAVKKDKSYEKVVTLLLGIFYLYKNSPKQRKGLRETYKALSMSVVLPHRVGGSRWMPHMKKALTSFLTGYKAILSHLQTLSHSNAKAEGLARLAASYDIVAYAAFLNDVLEPLSKLSMTLQRQDITLGDVHLIIWSTVDVIGQCVTSKSERFKEILETKTFAGFTLSTRRQASQKYEDCIESIQNAITIRFQDLGEDLLPTVIASFKNWPKESSEEYGNDHVKSLCTRFKGVLNQQGVQIDEIGTEWKLLKSIVYRRYAGTVQSLKWSDISSMLSSMGVGNVLKLVDLVNSLPPTSVQNETAFNQMKLIKTERRHRLSSYNLNAAMVMRIESPSIVEYDPTAAINIWMITPSGQKRRTGYKRGKTKENQQGIIEDPIVIDNDEAVPIPLPADNAEEETPIPLPADNADEETPIPLPADNADEETPIPLPADNADEETPIPLPADNAEEETPIPLPADNADEETPIPLPADNEPEPAKEILETTDNGTETGQEVEPEITTEIESVTVEINTPINSSEIKDDEEDDSGEMNDDESDFEFEQSEEDNYHFIVKFAAEE